MSVFSLKTRQDNPVTLSHLDSITKTLGVTLPDSEKEEYRTLLAVYHESVEKIMAMDGTLAVHPFK
jgi:amidase